MKKTQAAALLVLVTIIFSLILSGNAWAAYATTQLTSNSYNDLKPQINSVGQAVWEGWDGHDWEIFLYSGGVVTQITNDNVDEHDPQINTAGHIVWQQQLPSTGFRRDIFFYSSGSITRVTTDNHCNSGHPQLNDNDQIVWSGGEMETYDYGPPDGLVTACSGDTRIFMNSGGSTQRLAAGLFSNIDLQINNLGQVAWDDTDINLLSPLLYFYTSGAPHLIYTSYAPDNLDFQLNNAGQIVIHDGTGMYLFGGQSGTNQIPDSSSVSTVPAINDSGKVAWAGWDYGSGQFRLFLYDGSTSTPLFNLDYNPADLKINNSDQLAWLGGAAGTGTFLGSAGVITGMSNDNFSHGGLQLSDNGEAIWYGHDGHDAEIFLFERTASCAGGKPALSLSLADSSSKGYWASFADYLARTLSVDYRIVNNGSDVANAISITDVVTIGGIACITPVPIPVGDLGAGGSAGSTLKYIVPSGVSIFKTTLRGSAQDGCGDTYTYPQ